jgi:hypothetical protein
LPLDRSQWNSAANAGVVAFRQWEHFMETILIVLLIVFLLGGGGWYGRGRWYGRRPL